MTDSQLLVSKINECGFKISAIAKKLGLSRQGLWKKIYNRTEFKQSEIEKLSEVLNLDPETNKRIFFSQRVG